MQNASLSELQGNLEVLTLFLLALLALVAAVIITNFLDNMKK